MAKKKSKSTDTPKPTAKDVVALFKQLPNDERTKLALMRGNPITDFYAAFFHEMLSVFYQWSNLRSFRTAR